MLAIRELLEHKMKWRKRQSCGDGWGHRGARSPVKLKGLKRIFNNIWRKD